MDNNYNMNSSQEQGGYALDWDSSITRSEGEFIVFPNGDYDFEVVSFERGQHNGSEKLPPCKKVTLQLRAKDANGQTVTVRENLFLYSTQMNKLCAFFESIGQGPDAQGNIRMNWNAVIGSKGRASLGVREYNGRKYNEVKRFLKPSAQGFAAAPQQNYAAPAPQQSYAAPQGYAAPNSPAPQQNFAQVNTPTPWDGQQQTFGAYTGGKF